VTDPPPYGESERDAGGDPTTGAPRWVKVFGIVALALALLFVILHLAFGGFGGHSQR
jgi:hypothetical protein